MRVVSLLLPVVLLSNAERPLGAQGSLALAEVQPGARVRVEAPGIVAGKYVGTVLARRADTLTLGNPSGAPVVLPLGAIRSLEISRGKSRSAGAVRGMMWGAPIGAAVGAFGIATAEECSACFEAPGDAETFAAFTVAGLLWGAGIGAIVGRERWDRFDLPVRTALRVGPRSAALAIVLLR
jgi:hypothetical protein